MKTIKDITLTVLGGHRNMVIPAGTRCHPAHNIPPDKGDPIYWVQPSRKMDRNARDGIRCHGVMLKKSEILNGIHD